jgi:hypothetical protein
VSPAGGEEDEHIVGRDWPVAQASEELVVSIRISVAALVGWFARTPTLKRFDKTGQKQVVSDALGVRQEACSDADDGPASGERDGVGEGTPGEARDRRASVRTLWLARQPKSSTSILTHSPSCPACQQNLRSASSARSSMSSSSSPRSALSSGRPAPAAGPRTVCDQPAPVAAAAGKEESVLKAAEADAGSRARSEAKAMAGRESRGEGGDAGRSDGASDESSFVVALARFGRPSSASPTGSQLLVSLQQPADGCSSGRASSVC